MHPIHVAIDGRKIVLAVIHSSEGPPPEFEEAVARVISTLDAAGIKYEMRGGSFSVSPSRIPVRPHRRRRVRV